MGKSRVALLAFLLFVLATATVSSQSDAILDSVLEQDAVSYGDAAYLVLSAVGEIPESANPQNAISSSGASSWGFEGKTTESPTSYGEYSYMLMTSLNISGGLLYRVFPGPRYAARELSFLGIAPYRVAPSKILNGDEAVRMLSAAIEMTESTQ